MIIADAVIVMILCVNYMNILVKRFFFVNSQNFK